MAADDDDAGLDERRNTRWEFLRFPRTVVVVIVFIAVTNRLFKYLFLLSNLDINK